MSINRQTPTLATRCQIDDVCAQNTDDLQHSPRQLDRGQLTTCRGWRCEVGDQVRERVIERLARDLELHAYTIEIRDGLVSSSIFQCHLQPV